MYAFIFRTFRCNVFSDNRNVFSHFCEFAITSWHASLSTCLKRLKDFQPPKQKHNSRKDKICRKTFRFHLQRRVKIVTLLWYINDSTSCPEKVTPFSGTVYVDAIASLTTAELWIYLSGADCVILFWSVVRVCSSRLTFSLRDVYVIYYKNLVLYCSSFTWTYAILEVASFVTTIWAARSAFRLNKIVKQRMTEKPHRPKL